LNSNPTELQLDALREVANVGCAHAASALSQLVGGRKVQIDVPRVMVTPINEMAGLVGGADARVVAAQLGMEGELKGHLLLVLPEKDAFELVGLLLNERGHAPLSEIQLSALGEAANIVASACLSAIGTLANLRLLPSIPTLNHDTVGQVLDDASELSDTGSGLVVLLEARFFTATQPLVGGELWVLPDEASLQKLLQRLGV
jgi:chemotaxis protein CheC